MWLDLEGGGVKSDLINGLFELLGSLFVWLNVRQIWRDRGYKGVHILPAIVFNTWGFWNLYYYPHLHQWGSFAGGVSMVLANSIYVGLMVKFGKGK